MRLLEAIWHSALASAGDIFSELIGDLLGWLIVLALVLPVFLIIYFLMKKMGYGKYSYDPKNKTRSFSIQMSFGNPPDASAKKVKVVETFVPLGGKRPEEATAPSPPSRPDQADMPDWQKGLITSGQEEETEKRRTIAPTEGEHAPDVSVPTDMPEWQKEMISAWQQGETEKRQDFAGQLQDHRARLLGLYKVLVYSVAGALALGGIFFFIKASRGHTEFAIVGLVLLGAAAAVCTQWNPSQFE